MGMSIIILGKSENQARMREEGKFICIMGTIFTWIFEVAREELSFGKSTNHVLEGFYCFVVLYVEKEVCVPVKWDVIM
jgi:hypothetical protein